MDPTEPTQVEGWKARFLTSLSKTGNVKESCEIAGVNRQYAYEVREKDPAFAQEWASALADAADVLEREAVRRGMEGYDEPVYYLGQVVGTVRKYSDQILILLLKAAKPDKFRENIKQELTGPGGAPLLVQNLIAPPPQTPQ